MDQNSIALGRNWIRVPLYLRELLWGVFAPRFSNSTINSDVGDLSYQPSSKKNFQSELNTERCTVLDYKINMF